MGRDEEAVNVGPLAGIKIIELAGIGPGPMCAMLLADLGATVLRIDRTQPVELGIKRPLKYNLLLRNRTTIALDLKKPAAVEAVLDLIEQADALIEGFRPGVTERLGLGPDVCLARNPRLIYGRMTGWGQSGPLAHTAGHDIGYIAITGVLNAIGRKDQPPTVPLNLLGDYAGGSLYLALGMLAGIIEARASGKGQVVDAAIVDGAASLATTFFGMHAAGMLSPKRGTQHDGFRLALLRRVRVRRRQMACGRPDREQVLRAAAADPRDRSGRARTAARPGALAARPRRCWRQDSRRKPRDEWAALFAADRRLRRAGARLGGGARAPALQSARHVRRSRRRRATCAGAALQPHDAEQADDRRTRSTSLTPSPRCGRGSAMRRSLACAATASSTDRDSRMDLRFTPDEIEFRNEVREFFRTALPEDIRRKAALGQRLSREELVRWQRILNKKGWATPAWAPEWGGTGWSPVKQYIFKEELHMAPAPEPLSFNVNMIGPTLIAFGTEEQKRHFLPRIAQHRLLVLPGLFRAGRRLRPGRAAHDRRARRRSLRHQRPEALDLDRAPRRLVLPASCAPIRRRRSSKASRTC